MSVLFSLMSQVSFDELAMATILCLALRESLVRALPDRIAGPGGWLIDTGRG